MGRKGDANSQCVGNRFLIRTRKALGRPTLLAQLWTAASSLVLVALLTRGLPVDDFGRYSALLAVVAFGNALIGSTLATRAIEAAVRSDTPRLTIVVTRDAAGMLGATSCVAAFGWSLGAPISVIASASAAMLGFFAAELAGAHFLGLRRFWVYAAVTIARTTIWVVGVAWACAAAPENDRLTFALLAIFVSSLVPAIALAAAGLIRVSVRPPNTIASPISWVGICNLALWLLASGDRVVLSYSALGALAGYVALYGILDRLFRTFSTAYIQRFLPDAFSTQGLRETSWSGTKLCALLSSLILMLLGGALAAPIVVSAVSGGQYVPSAWMALILTGAMIAMGGATPAYVRLVGAGRGRGLALLALAVAFGNVIANVALAPKYGADAAAVLSLIGYAVWCGGVWCMWSRETKLSGRSPDETQDR